MKPSGGVKLTYKSSKVSGRVKRGYKIFKVIALSHLEGV